MRCLVIVGMAIALAACQSPSRPTQTMDIPEPPQYQQVQGQAHVGSQEWMEMVTEQAGVSDGQGGGPDYGSQEWCDAVYYRLYGQRAAQPVACDQQWMLQIDEYLRQR